MSYQIQRIIRDGNNIITLSKSNRPTKKYKAVIKYKDGAIKTVHFGGINMTTGEPYDQYKDATGLGLYSKYDHNDKKRRDLYYLRHGRHNLKYSPTWFSARFLWPMD